MAGAGVPQPAAGGVLVELAGADQLPERDRGDEQQLVPLARQRGPDPRGFTGEGGGDVPGRGPPASVR